MEPAVLTTRCFLILVSVVLAVRDDCWGAEPPRADPFQRFELPDAWESNFWASPNAHALLILSPQAVADLVPTQAGIHFCRCPVCEVSEADEPLTWSVTRPQELLCRACGASIPKDLDKKKGKVVEEPEKPRDPPKDKDKDKDEEKDHDKKEKKEPKEDKPEAKDDKKGDPEDTVEVLPGVIHKYPYHEVEPERQRYPDERLYLAAKRDDQAREILSKTALYAAVRYHEQPLERKDSRLARLTATIVLRFAQTYPAYATHYDQPNSPKYFDKADLPPPYRRGYQTGKWEWTGSQNVPLNLVIAYALIREDPALAEAGRLLKEVEPNKIIEENLFRASAEFARRQTDELTEASLHVDRGILAVGRLLNDPTYVADALGRLERFAMRGFYHDGFWREGTLTSHRRVIGQLDGYLDRLLAARPDPPMLALARHAGSAVLTDQRAEPSGVVLASWPDPELAKIPRAPILLGGLGLARLAIGQGENAVDLELRGLDTPGPDQIERQALRLSVGGRTVLGDLDEGPGLASGFDRASVSRNTVVVDGLNQRESPAGAREPAPGGDFLFFAADPDFQVVTLDDPRAYPVSTTRYRQTLIASAGARARYAISVFEVSGGTRHDELFQSSSGSSPRWRLSVPTTPGPDSLLAPGLSVLPTARASDGRWFVQSYGNFHPISQGVISRPAQAWLANPGLNAAPGPLRIHLLTSTPLTAITATSPDLAGAQPLAPRDESVRGSLIVRHQSADGAPIRSIFLTVFEPVSAAIPPLTRVGLVPSTAGMVVIYLETADGLDYVCVNLSPGKALKTTLPDGRSLETDGLSVRLNGSGLVLAGGTFAACAGQVVRINPAIGRIVWAARQVSEKSHGWFESDSPLPDPDSLAGRVLLIRHGDGLTRGWTLTRVENTADGARLHVREEPGFLIDPETDTARYYQFPHKAIAGPNTFRIARIVR